MIFNLIFVDDFKDFAQKQKTPKSGVSINVLLLYCQKVNIYLLSFFS